MAACGGDDDESGAETTTEASATDAADDTAASSEEADEDVDPEGVLRLPFAIQTLKPNYDPANPTPPNPNRSPVIMVYDTLLRATGENGELEPGLAKEVQYVDASTVHVILQEGVKFSDGTTFDAEAVKTGIEYLRGAESGVLAPERLAIADITVDAPLELTLHLSEPIAGEIINLMAFSDFLIPSPTAIAGGDLSNNPVGAGPFLLEEYTPEEKIVLVKNPDYFQADQIRIARVEFINAPPGEALVNAIASGTVDAGENVDYQTATALQGADQLEIEVTTGPNQLVTGGICKNRAPWDDVRVRQALVYATDREALNEVLYQGQGELMTGLWPKGHKFYDADLEDVFTYDPDKARSLLQEAGVENLSFPMYFGQPGTESARIGEILQAQWAEAGIQVELKPLTNPLDMFPDAIGGDLALFPLNRLGIQRVVRSLQPGSISDVCNYDNPELNQAVADVKASEPGSEAEVAAWKRVQEHVHTQVALLPLLMGVQVTIYNPDRLGDVSFMPNQAGLPTINFYETYVRK